MTPADTNPLREAAEGLLPWLEDAETKCLVGDEGCIWAVELLRAALASEPVAGTVREDTPEAVLNDIRDALETRGYFHMANGRDIGLLIDTTICARPNAPVEVKDTYLVGGPDLKAMSGSVESNRVIQLHFRRPVNDKDREWLLEAINAKIAADGPAVPPQAGATTASALQSVSDEIERKIAQLEHYRDNDCQLDHAKTIAEGRLLQARMDLNLIGKALQAATPPAPGAADRAEWQDIATAPKDDPIILGWRTAEEVDLVGEGYWDDGFEGCVDQPAYPSGWCIPSLNYFNVDKPTLWRHLPTLPRADRGGSHD